MSCWPCLPPSVASTCCARDERHMRVRLAGPVFVPFRATASGATADACSNCRLRVDASVQAQQASRTRCASDGTCRAADLPSYLTAQRDTGRQHRTHRNRPNRCSYFVRRERTSGPKAAFGLAKVSPMSGTGSAICRGSSGRQALPGADGARDGRNGRQPLAWRASLLLHWSVSRRRAAEVGWVGEAVDRGSREVLLRQPESSVQRGVR
jgi:hypothetical protein